MLRRALCCAVVAVFAAAAGFAAGVPNTSKLLVYAERPLDGAAIHAAGGTLIRQYPLYTLYRVPTPALAGLQRAAKARKALIEVVDQWDTISLPNARIDTRVTSDRRDPANAARTGLYVVQFAGPIADDDQRLLDDAGLVSVGYVPHNGALVAGSAAAIERISRSAAVQWVSTFDREYKAPLSAAPQASADFIVQFANVPDAAVRLRQFRATHEVVHEVSYGNYTNFRVRLDPAQASALLDDPLVVTVEGVGRDVVSGEREAIASGAPIATQNSYNPFGYPFQMMDGSYQESNGFFFPLWRPHRPNLSYFDWVNYFVPDASRFRVALADTGLRRSNPCANGPATHPDLQGISISWGSDWFNPNNCNQDLDGHGTMVAGMVGARPNTAASDASVLGTFNYGMGVAPQSALFIQRIASGTFVAANSTIFDWVAEARGNGCVVQNHSHNAIANQGEYDLTAQQYDFAVRDMALPLTVSAGNNGCTGTPCSDTQVTSPATAKNVITVGASESYRPNVTCNIHPPITGGEHADSLDNAASLSRRGTQDGRIKPDILAPGTMISSTHAIGIDPPYCMNVGAGDGTGHQLYDIAGGTSFSAPQAAAAIALAESRYNRQGSFSPALVKAMLVSAAKSMAGGFDRLNNTWIGPRPNIAQGFGRLYLGDLIGAGSLYFLWEENDPRGTASFTGPGQSRTGYFTLNDPSRPTVIVLAWTDEPAIASMAPTLVRDLNLTVTNGCERYSGNYTDPWDRSVQQDGCNGVTFYADHTNNVEVVYLPAGYASNWNGAVLQWRVDSYSWGSNGASPARSTQPFVIVGANVY